MTSFEIVITVAIVVAGTLLTRFAAFLIFPPGKKAPDFVLYLGKALPAAVMGMLVVYTFKDTIVLSYPYGVPELIALLVTVGMHVWKRNMFMSIGAGTVVYMILVQAVFNIPK
ncbi:MAG: branched-chain amino acid transporter permease [Veillonella sp.]|uniref:branched-chain amino acid transporter permease n=1 Tax=Veillonella sp. TaxID=1926307 RepID=UPI0028FEBDA2|nr:branched-chain amino acid transporter permease [Veillonella sp.]MDU0876508.1 branched-chain amino acid transporter permease [Veillonella sp.]MDU0932828.1 branched-chain amino acid transporter permease [Veillonella sp.]